MPTNIHPPQNLAFLTSLCYNEIIGIAFRQLNLHYNQINRPFLDPRPDYAILCARHYKSFIRNYLKIMRKELSFYGNDSTKTKYYVTSYLR